ncbi:SLAM family member 9-like isoform X3 [Muntiacus reevesi]|uniref:SLAM family member 9-like isoform X3 n=1 Tax=Muntiacus reevesi TaxID=9886 RepID=UPI003306BBBE
MDSLCSSWLPTQTLILQISLIFGLTSASPDYQAVKYPSSSCTLKRTVGASVQLPLTSPLNSSIREIEWNWQSENDENTQLVTWKPQTPTPDWYDLEEIYKHRLNLTEKAFLSIRNLTMEMSGLYTAKIKFNSGKSKEEKFRLCLYDPVPHPQIQIRSSSNTSGWCNISLECEIPGNTGNLKVVWLSQGLPRHLEHRGIPLSSRNLSLSLPISHINSHLTCVVSNPAEEKNATLHLEDICPWRGLTEADLTPAFDSRFSSEQMALALHPTHGSDGEPRGWSVDLDEKEDAYQERWVYSPANGSPSPSDRGIYQPSDWCDQQPRPSL